MARTTLALGLMFALLACGDPMPATDGGITPPDAPVAPLACEIVAGGCDEILTNEGGTYLSITDRHIPGHTICIAAGTYSQLYLSNVTGDEGNPVTIINCGGRVVFDTARQQIGIEGVFVQHLHLTGSGDPAIEHGIEQFGAALHGVSFDQGITDIEIDHLEVHHGDWVGIGVRSYPRCDGRYHRANWTQYDTSIHHNHVHDMELGEGMYIGTSHYHLGGMAYLAECPELGYLEPALRRAHVHDNLVEDVGADGIQVGAAIEEMEITRNVVRRYAIRHDPGDVGGLQINPGSVGLVHDNWIESFVGDGAGTAIQYAGGDAGDTEIYDNVIVGAPWALMTLGRMIGPAHRTVFRDNTIVSRGGLLTELYCNPELTAATAHPMSMTGNVFVGYESLGPEVFTDESGTWYRIFSGNAEGCPIDGHVYPNALEPDLMVPGNFYARDVAEARFVDAAAGDYRLMADSPAAGMGATLD